MGKTILEIKIERFIETGEITYELNQLGGGDIVLDLSNCHSLHQEFDSYIASSNSSQIPFQHGEQINRETPILNLFSERLAAMVNCERKRKKYRFRFLGRNRYFI